MCTARTRRPRTPKSKTEAAANKPAESAPPLKATTSPVAPAGVWASRTARREAAEKIVSCLTNTLLDPPADCRAGQGAPTRHSAHYGEEAQRRPARQDAAQRVRYL